MQHRDVWRKVKVTDNGVYVEKEFYHNYKPESVVYLGSQNDLLLEFTAEWINVYHIRDDKNTEFLDEIRRENQMMAETPIYFTENFRKYLSFEFKNQSSKSKASKFGKSEHKVVKLYQTKPKFDGHCSNKQFEKFKENSYVFLPKLEDIRLQVNQASIWFNSPTSISYTNNCMIEQTIKLLDRDTLFEHQDFVKEKLVSQDELLTRTIFKKSSVKQEDISTMAPETRLQLQAKIVRDFNTQLMTIS